MNSKRLYLVLSGVACLLILGLVAGTYGADSLLTSQSNKLVKLKAKSQALDQEQLILVKIKKQVQTYSNLNQVAKEVVPQDKDQAETVREIANIAATNKIELASISFPQSSLGGVGGSTTSGSASIAPAQAKGAAGSKATTLSQLTPVKNIPGVYLLQIVIANDPTQSVPYAQFISFLQGLERNRRTAQVSTVVIQPGSHQSDNVSFTLTLNEYIKP
ncbi:MAG TPA: hypothetical protein VH234_02735 [Candidatus Saccharimonadales bacterium]|jgi:hypothetical protein|nr:hypothetical protein [Candidatus Saccharimonadales bacterium]